MNKENIQEDIQGTLEKDAIACSRSVRGAVDEEGNDVPGAVPMVPTTRRWTWICLVITSLALWGGVLTLALMALCGE